MENITTSPRPRGFISPYSPEEKRAALVRLLAGETPYRVSKDTGITINTLKAWRTEKLAPDIAEEIKRERNRRAKFRTLASGKHLTKYRRIEKVKAKYKLRFLADKVQRIEYEDIIGDTSVVMYKEVVRAIRQVPITTRQIYKQYLSNGGTASYREFAKYVELYGIEAHVRHVPNKAKAVWLPFD